MKQAFKIPKLIRNVPSISDAYTQLAIARNMHEDEQTQETYSNFCRALMVLNTKKIGLSAEEMKELKQMKEQE